MGAYWSVPKREVRCYEVLCCMLQAAGFALPAVDTEVIRITYPDAWTLWHHL